MLKLPTTVYSVCSIIQQQLPMSHWVSQIQFAMYLMCHIKGGTGRQFHRLYCCIHSGKQIKLFKCTTEMGFAIMLHVLFTNNKISHIDNVRWFSVKIQHCSHQQKSRQDFFAYISATRPDISIPMSPRCCWECL